MPKIPMLGVRLFDPDDSRFKLTRRFMAHLVRLRQATVEAAKSLSMKELDELVRKLPDEEVDRIDRRVGLILAARAKLPGAGHLKTEDRNALRALANGAELIAIPSEHHADEIAAELHTDMPWMGPANELAWHAMRRSVREGWKGFRLPPMLLDGPPGIGKSHWARKLGELLTAPVMVLEAGSEGASFGLVGSQRGWGGAEPGRLIRTILRTAVSSAESILRLSIFPAIRMTKGAETAATIAGIEIISPACPTGTSSAPAIGVISPTGSISVVTTAKVESPAAATAQRPPLDADVSGEIRICRAFLMGLQRTDPFVQTLFTVAIAVIKTRKLRNTWDDLDPMLDNLSDVLAFVRVADTASFTRAAEGLGLTRSAVGKSITRLEASLATRLIHRTTRSITLTEEGRLFYDHALRILCEVDDAAATLAERNQIPKGRLRIDLPIAFGRLHILPLLQRFLAEWPELQADVSFSDDYRDLVCEGIDLAIRIGGPEESGLIRQVLAPHRLITCASPAYLERRGVPQSLDDLARHERIIFTHRNCGVPWRYASGEVEARGALRLSHTEAVRDAVLAGGGLAQLGAFLVGEDIRQGRLIPVLQDHTREETPITAVYPTRRHVSPKVRRFVSMIRDAWAGGPPWQQGK